LSLNGTKASVLGVFAKSMKRTLVKQGEQTAFPRTGQDPYERILSGRL
jgi:hypothetical protein